MFLRVFPSQAVIRSVSLNFELQFVQCFHKSVCSKLFSSLYHMHSVPIRTFQLVLDVYYYNWILSSTNVNLIDGQVYQIHMSSIFFFTSLDFRAWRFQI